MTPGSFDAFDRTSFDGARGLAYVAFLGAILAVTVVRSGSAVLPLVRKGETRNSKHGVHFFQERLSHFIGPLLGYLSQTLHGTAIYAYIGVVWGQCGHIWHTWSVWVWDSLIRFFNLCWFGWPHGGRPAIDVKNLP